MVGAYSSRQSRRAWYSFQGWMLGLYQKATGSMPSALRGSIQLREQGAQQQWSKTVSIGVDLVFILKWDKYIIRLDK